MGKHMVYTRREYIHRMPQSMITKFTLGNSKFEYEFAVSLIASKKLKSLQTPWKPYGSQPIRPL